jgi:acyl-CoA oxidase
MYTIIISSAISTGKAPNQTVDYLEGIFDYLSDVKDVIQTKEDLYDVNKIKEVLRYNVAFNVATAGQKL